MCAMSGPGQRAGPCGVVRVLTGSQGGSASAHLKDFTNVLQADGMRGFEAL